MPASSPKDTDLPPPSDDEGSRGPGLQGGQDDDMPPSGEEARAQSRETVMPLIYIGLGVIAIVVFVAVMALYQGVPFHQAPPPPPGVAKP